MKQQGAAYRHPRAIWIADELPKGPTGKILEHGIGVPETLAAGGGA